MAKKKSRGLADSLNTNLGEKVELKKKNINLNKVDEVTEELHTSKKEKVATEKVVLQKMTIEIPKSLHKQIKIKVAQEGIKIKDYIIQLVHQDLKD